MDIAPTSLFTELEAMLIAMTDARLEQVLLDFYGYGYDVFRPLFACYFIGMGVALYRGAIELTMKEFMSHMFTIFIVFSFGLNAWGYTTFIKGGIEDVLSSSISMISPSYTSFAGELDKQIYQFLGFIDKLKAGEGWFWPYALSVITAFFAAVYAIYLFGMYMMAKIAVGMLLTIGPLIFLSLLSKATKRFFEQWYAQIANYLILMILMVAFMGLLASLIEEALSRIDTTKSVYELGDVWPTFIVMGLMLFAVKELRNMAAAISQGFSLTDSGGFQRLTNSIQKGVSITANVTGKAYRGGRDFMSKFQRPSATNQIVRR
ncbi:type IV secretion system protein [Bowmanella yangjiangensis]|uniref:Type IV secretion system protein n=1 Tax=Bowmanella yangjiangensis TaxID=2811230 RepID=A0ABS3CRS3_9ALTE|nr:type IV secretion system protein [Bowmanella yangjiangensis]MBN7819330.1 type IV secretion system protein [Bowmanella yangjiangensis]